MNENVNIEMQISAWISNNVSLSYRQEPLLVTKLREILPPEKVLAVLAILSGICRTCLDEERPCYCHSIYDE